ncbi:hypothetical protein D9M70_290540 [compost metagenome]
MNRLAATLLSAYLWISAAQANDVVLQLQQLRSTGFSVCASVLVQFNDYEEGTDPRRPETYRSDLTTMRQIAQHLQATSELTLIDAMQREITELETLPRRGTNRYGHGLEALLKLHAQLDQKLAERYAEQTADTPATTLALHALALDTGRILLLYQARTFVLLPKPALDISEETNRQIDERIANGFQRLGSAAPDLSAPLAPIQRRYQFVRDKLINFQQNWAPSGVALYLDRNIHDLDKPAA